MREHRRDESTRNADVSLTAPLEQPLFVFQDERKRMREPA
jgi:hypothetical protein